MKESLEAKEVKGKYFYVEGADVTAHVIEHDKFKIDAVYKAMKTIDRCYLDNLLKTAKHYFPCSLNLFKSMNLIAINLENSGRKRLVIFKKPSIIVKQNMYTYNLCN